MELNPDKQNCPVRSCSQSTVEPIPYNANSRGKVLEPTRQEAAESKEDGHQTLAETLDKNNFTGDAVLCSTDCTQSFDVEDLTPNVGNSSDEVNDSVLNDCCETVSESVVAFAEVQIISPECSDTLFESCENPVEISVEVGTTPLEYRETSIKDRGDQDQMVVEDILENGQRATTECSKSLIEGCENVVQMDVENTSGVVQTILTDCGENLSKGGGGLVQKTVESSLREEQSISSKCSEKLFDDCGEFPMAVDSTLGEVQSTGTSNDDEILSEGCASQVQMNVKNRDGGKPTTSSERSEKLLEDHGNEAQTAIGNSISLSEELTSSPYCVGKPSEFVVEKIGSSSLDEANVLSYVKKCLLNEDTLMDFSVTGLSQLTLEDCVAEGIVESSNREDLLPVLPCDARNSKAHLSDAQVQSSDKNMDVPNTICESSDNLSSMNVSSEVEVDMSLTCNDSMLSEILETGEFDGIILSTFSSQESNSDDTSDSDRLWMDCGDSPKRKISTDVPKVIEIDSVEQNSSSRISEATVSQELSNNLVDSGSSRFRSTADALPHRVVPRELNETLFEEKSSLLEKVQSSEQEIAVESDSGLRWVNGAYNLVKNEKEEVKMGSLDKEKELEGMSPKIVVQNGVLSVPSRMVVKRKVATKPEVDLNPSPSFDVGSVWQVVKKRALGMNAKMEG